MHYNRWCVRMIVNTNIDNDCFSIHDGRFKNKKSIKL